MNGVVVLILLLLAVPLQLYFNHKIQQSYTAIAAENGESLDEETAQVKLNKARQDAIDNLGTSLMQLKNRWISTIKYFSSWKHFKELFIIPRKKRSRGKRTESIQISSYKTKNGGTVKVYSLEQDESKSEKTSQQKKAKSSSVREVDEEKLKNEYFAQSKEPRIVRPANVQYSVGQVLRHKQDGYHGVIIGWDPVAKAPEWWLERYYKNREYVIETPHYHLLLDSHFDASGTPYHYIPAEDLEPCDRQVSAPEMDRFFEDFEDGHYIPRPWLKQIYPND